MRDGFRKGSTHPTALIGVSVVVELSGIAEFPLLPPLVLANVICE
jgi:hypothetical protein